MTNAPKNSNNLIFMIGLTGSGKSRLKGVLNNEFPINDDKQPEPIDDKPKVVVSVDDVFEEDPESIKIFHRLYTKYFGTKQCSDINKLTEEIPINEYLDFLFPEKENTFKITKQCVWDQIHRRYCPVKNTENISFSKFASAIYFALRVNRLDRKYDESIQKSVQEGKNVIIETNGESVNSIAEWYMDVEKSTQESCPQYNHTENIPCRAEGDAIDLTKDFQHYNKIVCFLRRDICETIKDLKKRALEKVCEFITKNDNNNEEKTGPIPRLPEIDDEILVDKMKGINGTYKAFKEDINGDEYKSKDVRVYHNIKDIGIQKVNDLPDSLYETTEIQCNNPKTTGGRKSKRRKSKRRKSKRRKSKQRKSKRRRLTKSKKRLSP
jgi:bisphosphoglycerate-dependent phosphoglycerate mutase